MPSQSRPQQQRRPAQASHPSAAHAQPANHSSFLDMDDPDSSFLDMPGGSSHPHPAPAMTTQPHHQSAQHGGGGGGNFLDMHDDDGQEGSFLDMGEEEQPGEEGHAAPHYPTTQMHPSTSYNQQSHQPVAGGSHFSGAYGTHNTDSGEGAEYEPDEHLEPPDSATTMVDPAMMGLDDDQETIAPHQNAMENLGYSGMFSHLNSQPDDELDDEGFQTYHGDE